MNINKQRPWITPLVVGIFLLMSVTGLLMFFHLDSGLNKTAHEWVGWGMVVAVGLHITLNWPAFKRYFTQTTGRWVMALCAAILVLSFVPLGGAGGGKPPFMAPVQALANAPLSVLAQVAGVTPAELRTKLANAGVTAQSDSQSIKDLVGSDFGDQMQILGKVLGH